MEKQARGNEKTVSRPIRSALRKEQHQAMTLLEKISWYYRNHGAMALLGRAGKKLLGMPGPSAEPSQPTIESLLAPSSGEVIDAASLVRANFPALQPLPVYSSPGRGERINLVTDNIGAGSLFGGVGTAIVLATLLAKKNNARLRIVTRQQEAKLPAVAQVLRCNGIELDTNIESVRIGPDDRLAQLEMGPGDRFITTSWWTTQSVLASVPANRVEYLLQEDERMFYPFGDEWLRCAELLARRQDDPALRRRAGAPRRRARHHLPQRRTAQRVRRL